MTVVEEDYNVDRGHIGIISPSSRQGQYLEEKRMSQMLTNIKRVVEADVSSRVTQMDALNEAITNSIHANATQITCRLRGSKDALKSDDIELFAQKVVEIEVEDNGDGFNKPNYDSFCEYRSGYKAELGCKGVGRFVFLKLFDNVRYTSYLAELNKKMEFSFSVDFNIDDVHEEDTEVTENRTVLRLSGVTAKYFNRDRSIDRRLDLCLQEIKDSVLVHLIPTLFLYKQKGVNIDIEFCDADTDSVVTITEADIPDFEKVNFSVMGADGEEYDFTLYYKLMDGTGTLHAFHCANKRTVCEFSENDLRISLPNDQTAYFLLESDYFDSRVNNERNAFSIYPVRTTMFDALSWEMINTGVKRAISRIVLDQIPDAVNMNQDKLVEIQLERPYLVEYIQPEDLDIAGFIDKGHIIKKAKKRFDDAKENLISHAGRSDYSDFDLQDAIQITQNELVSYIQDRVLVIERLRVMMEKKEQAERIIHNLFMERYTEDNYYCVGRNNLWLLDDRFTNYCYAASEKRINEILGKMELGEGVTIGEDRPDLALFFSHDPADKSALKSVLIELKAFKDAGKSDRKKFEGVQQLIDYISEFKKKEGIKEIWAFLVTDVDDKFEHRLLVNEFTPMFSTGRAIYYRYYEPLNAFIYVFGVQTLVSDAEARNKVFIDIVNSTSRLKRFVLLKSVTNAGGRTS